MEIEKINKKINFLLCVGREFHKYGANAPRLERALTRISNAIGLTGNYFSTPTYLVISIDNGIEQITRHARISPGDVDLEKLSDVDEIVEMVCSHELNISESMKILKSIETRGKRYNNTLTVVAYGLTSMSLAIIFGGNFLDGSFSFCIGSVLGLVNIASSKIEALEDIFEFLAAFICTFLAYTIKELVPILNFQVVLLSSLIVIIPGLSLTISMIELAAKNLVSGTARFMGAMVSFLKISFGVMGAQQLGKLIFIKRSLTHGGGVNEIWIIPAIIVAALSFTIIFKARPKDMKWIFLSGISGIATIHFLSPHMNDLIAVFTAGIVIGIGSNLFARLARRPAMIPLLPGIIFLVPGSIGFTGMNLIFESRYLEGFGIAFRMLTISITIVAGLFLANVLVDPRRSL